MNASKHAEQQPAARVPRLWTRISAALEEAGLSYAERLERRVSQIEVELASLREALHKAPTSR